MGGGGGANLADEIKEKSGAKMVLTTTCNLWIEVVREPLKLMET